MRATYILALALILAGEVAIITWFILSESGIILENYDALPGGRSPVSQNNEPEPRIQ